MGAIMNILKLGEFEVISGQIIITDLCYDINPERNINQIFPAKNGTWEYYVKKDDWVYEMECFTNERKELVQAGTVGVDSGTMTIMDLDMFKDFKKITWSDFIDEPIFPDIYKNGGAMADSFGGDGRYDLYVDNPEEITHAKVIFHKEQ